MKLCIFALLLLASIAKGADIHSVDFRNFRFHPSCLRLADSPAGIEQAQLKGEGESVIVTNGIFKSDNPDDPLDFRIIEINYGNLTSNQVAIVTTVCNTGGSGEFSEGFIYSMVNGQPKLLAVIEGGDRANGGIKSATIQNGLLRVERFGTNGGACCPEWVQVRDYQLRDGRLAPVGLERRRKYPEP